MKRIFEEKVIKLANHKAAIRQTTFDEVKLIHIVLNFVH